MTTRRWPAALQRGDSVALVSPSSPAGSGELAGAVEILKGWGLAVTQLGVAAPSGRGTRTYLAGPDRARAESLASALDPASDFRAIFCARGGYGAMRLLELPQFLDCIGSTDARWLIGSSDATALHSARIAAGGAGSVYGPMPATAAFADPEKDSADTLRRLLFGEIGSLNLTGRSVVPGEAEAPLAGGCLSLIAALQGTPFAVQTRGCIVLLEDVGEMPYRVDRMLTSLRLSGAFAGVAGIAVGSLERCAMTAAEEDELLLDRLGDLGVPVVAGLSFGHGPTQRPLLLGGPPAQLVARDDTGALEQNWRGG